MNNKNETIRVLKGFNKFLLDENHELKKKLAAEKNKCQSFFDEMIDANTKFSDLESKYAKLTAENAKLKSQKGSIYTVSKRETELERQLESERMRADELSAQLDTVSKRYDETQNAVTELMDENTMLKAKLEKYEKAKKGGKGRDNT